MRIIKWDDQYKFTEVIQVTTPSEKETIVLTDSQKNILKELGTKGGSQAASALTEFLEKPISVRVPSVRMASI
ncbi:MAG: hypothetical protein ACFFDE_06225 [Promethearchaeota archaeon]